MNNRELRTREIMEHIDDIVATNNKEQLDSGFAVLTIEEYTQLNAILIRLEGEHDE
ncbi:hypothetical protein [Enterococcus sp. C50]|uniref:hypothetical protein n=1 Tax=Enterococcus sp. C50 TaxID=3231311 RepID=UPI0034A07F65